MQKIGSALSLFHYEFLLSKIYRRDARYSSSLVQEAYLDFGFEGKDLLKMGLNRESGD